MESTKPERDSLADRTIRRKRWLIGLAIAFLALCGAVWKLTEPEPPRFKFLIGAELRYIRALRTPEPVCTTSYYVRGSQADVLKRAAPEVVGWSRTNMEMLESVQFDKGEERLTIVGFDFGEGGAPVTHVLVERPAKPIDFMRAIADETTRLLRFP